MLNQTRREFLQTVLGAVPGALVARSWLADGISLANTPSLLVRTIHDLDEAHRYDVCIVGSGPAGAVLGCELVRHGFETVLLESGPAPGPAPSDPRFSNLDAYSSSGELIYPVAKSRFRGAGGTSNLWTGWCTRFFPLDLEPNAYTPPDAPWPITYQDLLAYYPRAEKELRVRGGSSTSFAPPRSSPYPLALDPHAGIANLEHLFGDSNLIPEQIPRSDWEGKPVNTAVSHLPRFSRSSHGTLVCGATVTKILSAPQGKITGLEVQTLNRTAKVVRATFYILACGAIETPRLLLLSRSPEFPSGVGNGFDLVGRYFMTHYQGGVARGTTKRMWNPLGPRREVAISRQFTAKAKAHGLGGIRLNYAAFRKPLDYDAQNPFDSLMKSIRAVLHPILSIFPILEMKPSASNRVTLNYDRKDYFGNPGANLSLFPSESDRRTLGFAKRLLRKLFSDVYSEDVSITGGLHVGGSHHHMGTCRMGDDQRTSVVDKNLRMHATQNLYIAGSAPFVTCGVAEPTLTIVALSLRLADHLARRISRRL